MKNRLPNYLFFFILLITFSACNNPSDSNDDPGEYIDINSWIHANMEYYYYWNERVPEEPDGYMTPFNFYESMLEQSDTFSYMTDDAQSLLDDLNGSSYTAGFSPTFGRFTNSNEVFIIIEFVYPGSPAEEAGLKRGDIIIEINGTQLTTDNYLNLYYQEADAVYTLGVFNPDERTITSGETVTVSKAQLSLDPVVYTNIIESGSNKIGYLFYAEFLTGQNDIFIQSVDTVLENFQEAGITDLIIDLRYNPGGRVSAAENLANSIAPPSVVENEEVFVRYEYNENLVTYFTENEGVDSPNLVARFSSDPVNLNLNRVYFLATSSSASASELLINGLSPHMEVISIGTSTFGKFYGSYVLTGMNRTPPHNYAIVPVTLKYANADGFSDFRDGLLPNYEVEEDLFDPFPIGDENDPLLSQALTLITGETEPPAKLFSPYYFEKLPDKKRQKTGNVFFEKSLSIK